MVWRCWLCVRVVCCGTAWVWARAVGGRVSRETQASILCAERLFLYVWACVALCVDFFCWVWVRWSAGWVVCMDGMVTAGQQWGGCEWWYRRELA